MSTVLCHDPLCLAHKMPTASAGFFSGVAFSGNPGTGVSSGVSAVVAIVGAVGLLWFISGDTVLLLIFAVLIAALPLTNAFLD